MTKRIQNNGHKTKSHMGHGTYSNLTSFFIDHEIPKYFDDFDN